MCFVWNGVLNAFHFDATLIWQVLFLKTNQWLYLFIYSVKKSGKLFSFIFLNLSGVWTWVGRILVFYPEWHRIWTSGTYLFTLPLFAGVSRVRALSPAWTGSHARETLISRTLLFLPPTKKSGTIQSWQTDFKFT
jgi:hypothetical protein